MSNAFNKLPIPKKSIENIYNLELNKKDLKIFYKWVSKNITIILKQNNFSLVKYIKKYNTKNKIVNEHRWLLESNQFISWIWISKPKFIIDPEYFFKLLLSISENKEVKKRISQLIKIFNLIENNLLYEDSLNFFEEKILNNLCRFSLNRYIRIEKWPFKRWS